MKKILLLINTTFIFFISIVPIILTIIGANFYRFTKRYKKIRDGVVISVGEYGMIIKDDNMNSYLYKPYFEMLYFKKGIKLNNFYTGQRVTFRRSISNGYNRLIAVDIKPKINDDYVDCDGYIEKLNNPDNVDNYIKNVGSACLYVNNFPKSFTFGLADLSQKPFSKSEGIKYGQKCSATLEKSTGRIFNLYIYEELHDIIKENNLNAYDWAEIKNERIH